MQKYALGVFGLAIIPAVWFFGALTHDNVLMPAAGFVAMFVGVLCMVIAGARLGKTWPHKLLFICIAIIISIVDIWLTVGFSIVLAGGGIA